MKKHFLSAVAALPFVAGCSLANDAVFSPDGGTIYMPGLYDNVVVYKVDVESGKSEKLALTGLPEDEYVEAVALTAKGELLLGGAKGLYSCGADGGKVSLVAKLENFSVNSLAVAPAGGLVEAGTILAGGYVDAEGMVTEKFLGIRPGGKELEDVFCRRVNSASGAAFSPEGRMFFVGNNDLWEGYVEPDEEADSGRLGTLTGCRIAPLAYENTDMANGGGMAVGGVVVSGDDLYVALRGRHMGALLRMKMPAAIYGREEAEQNHPELAAQYQMMGANLKGAKILVEEELSALAASPDGKLVFYRVAGEEGQDLMLITEGGEPKKIGTQKGSDQ